MHPFTTAKISTSEIITIINVWSYKVRSVICSFSFNGIKILWYWEKRQSRLDIINNEINNLSWLCETIGQSILKAEEKADFKSTNIIINPFLSNSFFSLKKIHYKKQDSTIKIDKKELQKIINSVESQSLSSATSNITSKFAIEKNDLKTILTDISSIKIDWNSTHTLLWEKAEDIKITISNMLIPRLNYQIIQDIAHYLNKKIIKIIPEEYAITTIWSDKKDIAYLNIGNSSSFISIMSNGTLQTSIKIEIWIQDLIKSIKKCSDKSRAEIIKKIDRDDLFKDEKAIFLSFFTDAITLWLSEILWNNICPHNFIITGWWANNNFIKEHIININFWKYWVKMIKNVEFIDISIKQIKKIIWVEDILKVSNINLISQIIATGKMLSRKKDPIEQALKKSLEKLT